MSKFNILEYNLSITSIESKLKPVLEEEEVSDKSYRQFIGSLMYAMLVTWPDICASVSYLSRYQRKPNEIVWTQEKHELRFLKGTLDLKLVYDRNISNNLLLDYVDADWERDRLDRRSNSGYVFQVYCYLVSCSSRKQPTVALSSMEWSTWL